MEAFTWKKFVLSSFGEKTAQETGRDLLQVVCIVARFFQLEADTQAAVRHGRARQTSGMEPCEDYRMVMWVPGPRGQYLGKICLSRNLRYRTRGRHMVKRSSDPRSGSLPRSQTSGLGLSASCGYCCPLSPHWEPVPGEIKIRNEIL